MKLGEQLGFLKQEAGFATKAIHVGQQPEQWSSRAVVPPISLATTFEQLAPGKSNGFEYSRAGNPSRKVLEDCLAALDNAKFAITFASGLGTLTAIISTLKTGDGIITNDDNYSGSIGLFNSFAVNMGFDVQFVDMTNLDNLKAAVKPNVKMVWLENPTNPTMKVIDIKAVAEIVHSETSGFLVVDNTVLSAYFQRPLDLGADVVMYSLTKYMNGHTDVIMGSVATNDEKLHQKLRYFQCATGIIPSPFDCFLVNRSLKTLSLRMERHFKSSFAIARFLESHPKVERVLNPVLPSHPQHKLALSQTYGHSGIMSFYIKDATLEMSTKFLQSLKYFLLATSFGGYESLAEVPSVMMTNGEQLLKFGVTDNLIRISVGLEDAQDLINDLDQALAAI